MILMDPAEGVLGLACGGRQSGAGRRTQTAVAACDPQSVGLLSNGILYRHAETGERARCRRLAINTSEWS